MKKIKLLSSFAVVLTAITPITIATGCSCGQSPEEKEKTLVEKIKEATIEEFIKISKMPRRTGYTYPVYKYIIKEVLPELNVKYVSQVTDDSYRGEGGNPEGKQDYEASGTNICFNIPASEGYENHKRFILHAPMDMLLVGDDAAIEEAKTKGIEVEKTTKDGKDVLISKGNKTTLGANGIYLAMIISMLRNKEFKHGPIRILFTADKEAINGGYRNIAQGLYNPDKEKTDVNPWLKDEEAVLNFEGNNVKSITTSSSSFNTNEYKIIRCFDNKKGVANSYELTISGLKGGSNADFSIKKLNAYKALGTLLEAINDETATLQRFLYIGSITSPKNDTHNLIPNKVNATISIYKDETKISEIISNVTSQLKQQYPDETNLSISFKKIDEPKYTISTTNTVKIINLLNKLNDGIYVDKDGVLCSQTLTYINILPSSTLTVPELQIKTAIRSNNAAKEQELITANNTLGTTYLSEIKSESGYVPPENYIFTNFSSNLSKVWTTAENSPITKVTTEALKHSGIEDIQNINAHYRSVCWSVNDQMNKPKAPGPHLIDETCLSATITDMYTPNETLYLDSLDKLISAVIYIAENFK